jgi:hypothetical protein
MESVYPEDERFIMRAISTLTLLVCTATAAAAQDAPVPMPESYRAVQIDMLELQRSMLLTMADSMPESLYRDRMTPEQRDFAQQLHHAASTIVWVCGRFFGAEAPALPDTSVALNNRSGLREYIDGAYDHAVEVMQAQSADDRAEIVGFFGGLQIPRWQVWDEMHQHTVWTAGQVVANFRKHGMAPPGFGFF